MTSTAATTDKSGHKKQSNREQKHKAEKRRAKAVGPD